MHDYFRLLNFTGLICQQHSSHLLFLQVGILTALGIHQHKTSQLFNFKARLGGEIRSSGVTNKRNCTMIEVLVEAVENRGKCIIKDILTQNLFPCRVYPFFFLSL